MTTGRSLSSNQDRPCSESFLEVAAIPGWDALFGLLRPNIRA